MIPRRVFLSLAPALLAAPWLRAAKPDARKGPPTVLPQVKVSGEVPLLKVADYQLLEPRSSAAVVSEGDYIYIVGGDTGGTLKDSIERFNVRTGKSERFGRLKYARRSHRAALVGGKIYVMGGYTKLGANRGPNASVEVIDIATGQVSAGVDMPKGRSGFGCVALGDKIYVIGGSLLKGKYFERDVEAGSGGSTESMKDTVVYAFTNTALIFDVTVQKWLPGPTMPAPCETACVLVPGPSIVVAGGFDGGRLQRVELGGRAGSVEDHTNAELDQLVAFNPRDNTWRAQPALHRKASGHSLAWLGNYVFLFGARDAERELIAYDLKAKQSDSYTLGYKPARFTSALTHEDKIYVIGGVNGTDATLDYVQVFALRRPPASAPAPTRAGA